MKNIKIFEEYEDFGKILRLFFLRFWRIFEEYEDFTRILKIWIILEDF
jgi:hypothetical protein